MQIIRFAESDGAPQYGVLNGDDVHALDGPLTEATQGARIAARSEVTLLNPCTPSNIVCAGGNYRSQLAEMNMPVPTQPVMFLKGLNTLSGPGDAIEYPRDLNRLEFEGELAVVIGKTARDVTVENYSDYVLGYTIANDVTASDFRADGQWTRAKSIDTFCPMGPWIETSITDPQALRIITTVNGTVVQDCGTDDMVFGVAELLAWITKFITLQPGDVVLTASPAGVGPMQVGDDVTISIDAIGELSNPVKERA